MPIAEFLIKLLERSEVKGSIDLISKLTVANQRNQYSNRFHMSKKVDSNYKMSIG